MGDLKEKFKGYGIAAWIILIGGTAIFVYGVKEIVMESYEDWIYPVAFVVLGIVVMRYPSLIASVFKLKTGLKNGNDAT